MKTRPINCYRCGRFVGKNGFIDVYYDDYNGGYEFGYPECASCLSRTADTSDQQESKVSQISADSSHG